MANNAKLRDQVRILEAKENWREAIAVLRQILENPEGESDIGLWNRVGDLHVRLSETDKAVEAYESAVNAYAEAGLHNNAIALCRKVLRLVPGRASVYLKLGQISAAKGFLADARQNFLEYAERMQRAGKLDASFDALREFADLSPSDTDVRRLLAEQLLSHERGEDAIEQFRILIGQAEAKGATAVADELRQQILEIDAAADTTGIVRDDTSAGPDDFHTAFALDPAQPAAPQGLETSAAPEISLGEIAPLEGFESTQLDVADTAPAEPAAPVAAAEEPAFALDFHIEPLDVAPAEEAEPLPLHDFGETADEDDGAAEPLPLMDAADFGDDLPMVAPLEGLDTGFDLADDDGAEDAGEPLPLMDFAAQPVPAAPTAPVRRDVLEELRERFMAAPDDVEVRRVLVSTLVERGLGYEAEALLDETHRDMAARARFLEAHDAVAALLELRPVDGTLLQKRVEYAFRANDRARLVPAYLALGEHLVQTGEATKGQAVFRRVLELEPDNARARAALPAAAAPHTAAPPPAPASPQVSDEYVDLNALILDDVRGEQSTRFVVEEKEPTGDEDRDFADMLKHFRQKVSENIEVEDSASHYDLGVAFKEMGLLDEAIAEFQVALRGGSNPLATLEMLGQCFVEKGQLAVAARVLDRALRITGAAEGELIGVLYQLGRTEEEMGHPDAALDYFERVLAIDIRFRDAVRRAEGLRAARGA